MRRPEGFRVAYIRDTLSLEDVYVSEAFRDEAQGRDDLSILSAPQPLPFDAGGWLASPFEAVR
jgi:hypothetical protein